MALPNTPGSAISEAREYKTIYEQIWNVSLAYTLGQQNLIYSARDKRYVVPENREIVFNLLLNLYRNVTSRLATAYPNVAVYPASPSSDDIAKAKASELALRYIWAEQDMISKYQELAQWLIICGTAAIYSFYNPDTDDVEVKVISPFDLHYEKYAMSPAESSWVAVRYYVNKEQAKRAYPEFAQYIQDQPQPNRDYAGVLSQAESLPKDSVEFYDFYDKEGNMGVVVGDKYLFRGRIPKGVDPVQMIKYTDIPTMLWGMSMITPLIDLQTQYNRSRNQVIKNTELMANPKWLVPKTAGISNQSITDQPGEKIYYNAAGGAPQVMPMPPIPQYVLDNINRIQAEISDIAGIHSVSLGKRAVGVTSGKAIENLSALDSSQLQVTQNNIEKATRILAKNILILMKSYYKEPKFFRMLDTFGGFTFKEINSLDIVDNPEVFIEAGTMFQDEIKDKEAKTMQMLQLGVITPQEAREQLNFKAANRDALEKMSSLSHAKKILQAVLNGNKVEIFMDDDLDSFRQVFKEVMNNDEIYYSLDEETQDYIADIYRNIISAIGQNAMGQQQGQPPQHQSIMPKAMNKDAALRLGAELESGTAREQLGEDVLMRAQQQAELNTAERGEPLQGLMV